MSFTIQSLMEKMPAAFLPEKAAGLKAVIQFKFSGVEAGDWFITIQDGHCMVEKGIHPAPQMTLSADSAISSKFLAVNSIPCRPLCTAN
jgi:hypothetical protein